VSALAGRATGAEPEDWTTPGVFEVAPGVYRVPLPLPNDGLRAVNVYVLVDDDGLVLIDSGWAVPEGRERLDAALRSHGWAVADIRRFLVTHLHRDHLSLALAIRQETGAPISLGAGERASLELILGPDHRPLRTQLEHLRALGADAVADRLQAAQAAAGRRPDEQPWGMPDHWLSAGELLAAGRNLTVLETPGHTRGHLVFHDEAAGLLFAGDHVLPVITPSIGFEPARAEDPLGAFLGSLAAVRARPDARVLPAHGPVADSVHRRVDELVAHHGRRLEQTEAAVAAGADTVAEVAARLPWTRRLRRFDELDPFNQMMAVTETDAHLVVLAAQGRVVRTTDPDGVLRHRV
jgi:glyoxylase-like metal-dependent hydrolase (beta-lactamase superfamily II)